MSESNDIDTGELERRYRRLLAVYPKAFRQEREEEMISVLMEGADDRQRWPRVAEALDLVKHALPLRLRFSLPTSRELKHVRAFLLIRVLTGIWLSIITVVLCQYVSLWGLALLLPAALHLYIAFRLAMFAERAREIGGPPRAAGS